jgi:hypothetical protein
MVEGIAETKGHIKVSRSRISIKEEKEANKEEKKITKEEDTEVYTWAVTLLFLR